jgi:hypothetical protein
MSLLDSSRRRRTWPLFVPALILLVVAAAWSAFWYSAANEAQRRIAEWLEREARLGRIYSCASQSIAGYPFRIEVKCDRAQAALNNLRPALSLELSDVHVAAQIYQPTLLIGEFSGPLSIAEKGKAPHMVANWELARTSVSGLPRAPERVSIVLDRPTFDRVSSAGNERLVSGERVEFHARIASGSPTDHPLLDVAVRLVATSAPGVHPLATQPVDAEVDTRLYGLKDFAPKPWPERFREIQAANGRIEVRKARVKQGEWLAVGAGNVGLNAAGKLQGELDVVVAGIDKLFNALGVDYLARSGPGSAKVNSALDALNQLLPGLGDVARQHAGTGAAVGLAVLGEQTELEGRAAIKLPLRFDDGLAFLGPIPIGQTQALF